MATTYEYDERTGEFVEREIQPPQITYFRLKDRAFIGRTATIEWSVEHASRVELQRVGPQQFAGSYSYPVTNDTQQWVLIAHGDTVVSQVLEVNASQLPTISKLEVASPIMPKYIIGDKIKLSYEASHCDKLYLNDNEIPNNGSVEVEISAEKETFTLRAEAGNETVSKEIVLEAYKRPEIIFRSSTDKLRKQRRENATLSWEITNAQSARLIFVGTDSEVPLHGSKTVSPTADTRYTIRCTALDGQREFNQRLTIKIIPEAEFTFSANHRFSLPGVPVVLSWNVANATSVKLEGDFPGTGRVSAQGQLTIESTTDTKATLKIKDAFGTRREEIEIKMLPLPRVIGKFNLPNVANKVEVNVNLVRPKVKVSLPEYPQIRSIPFVPILNVPNFKKVSFVPLVEGYHEDYDSLVKMVKLKPYKFWSIWYDMIDYFKNKFNKSEN